MTKIPRSVSSIEFCRELAEAGIIPKEMLSNIVDVGITLSPGEMATMQLDVLIDERIYSIMNPKKLKAFAEQQAGGDGGDDGIPG